MDVTAESNCGGSKAAVGSGTEDGRLVSVGRDGENDDHDMAERLNGWIPHARNPLTMFLCEIAFSQVIFMRPGKLNLFTVLSGFWLINSEQALLYSALNGPNTERSSGCKICVVWGGKHSICILPVEIWRTTRGSSDHPATITVVAHHHIL